MKPFLKRFKTAAMLTGSAIAIMAPVRPVCATPSLGRQTDIVSEKAESGSFQLEQNQKAAPIFFDHTVSHHQRRSGGEVRRHHWHVGQESFD
jgi:hypothetical protein